MAEIPPLQPDGCTPAFNQASARLRNWRALPQATVAANDLIARQLVFDVSQFEENSEGFSLLGHEAFFKDPYEVHRLSGRLSMEIITSHLAWDIGLPHAIYGILKEPGYRGDEYSVFSLAPQRSYRELSVLGSGDADDHKCVFSGRPHLFGSMLALTAFDIWVNNGDRHLSNLLHLERDGRHPEGLMGIDLDLARSGAPAHIRLRDGVLQLLQNPPQMATAMYPLFNALTAIEQYPAGRIRTIAERVDPFTRSDWPMDEVVENLVARRDCVRERMASLLSAPYAGQVGHNKFNRRKWRSEVPQAAV